jgi:UDP-glucose 4-epimerase
MRCLITGGAGFIGTNLIKKLLEKDYDVDSFDNYSTGYKENEQDGCNYLDIDIAQCDVGGSNVFYKKSGGWESIEKPDVIFHLAALARIQPSIKNPKPAIDTNFNGTLNILEYARENNIQVIYAGSSTKHHGVFNSPYAWSKFGGEELCRLYSKIYDLNTSICRFYNVYGPHHIRTGSYATVLGIFEHQFLNNTPITVTADGEQRRDFTHIDDIVDALISCIGKDFRAEEFELGRGKNYSINQIADMFGEDYPREYIAKRPGEYPETLADFSNAEEKLGWKATKNIEDYVNEWLGENKNV